MVHWSMAAMIFQEKNGLEDVGTAARGSGTIWLCDVRIWSQSFKQARQLLAFGENFAF